MLGGFVIRDLRLRIWEVDGGLAHQGQLLCLEASNLEQREEDPKER